MKSSLKLVVGIVTYNPDNQTLQRIKMLLDNGIDFVVVDNTPGDDFWPISLRSWVIRDGRNWGLGLGLKKLGEWAVNEKYTHLLYFDQDVIFTVDSLVWIDQWYGHHQPKESVGLIWFNQHLFNIHREHTFTYCNFQCFLIKNIFNDVFY